MIPPAIELTHLRYFIALAEECHFGRASARLGIAQPPLTRQIKLLEARLQCRLFERTSRSTRLTAAGEQLLESARAVVAAADHAVLSIQRLGSGQSGQMTLATAPSLLLGALPKTIRRYRKTYRSIDFRLLEMATSAILQAVQAGVADLGLIRGLDACPDIETHLQWEEAMVAIVPNDSPLAAKIAVSVSQLRSESFVFFPRHLGPSFYDEVMAHCQQAGFRPAVFQEARQWSSILSFVRAGMGVSIGPQSVAGLLPKAVTSVPIKGFRTAVRLVGRRGASNPAAANFLKIARMERLVP